MALVPHSGAHTGLGAAPGPGMPVADKKRMPRSDDHRRAAADTTLTLRLTRQDRALLQELVSLQAAELADTGMESTAASYVRGLIRHEARAKGLLSAGQHKR